MRWFDGPTAAAMLVWGLLLVALLAVLGLGVDLLVRTPFSVHPGVGVVGIELLQNSPRTSAVHEGCRHCSAQESEGVPWLSWAALVAAAALAGDRLRWHPS